MKNFNFTSFALCVIFYCSGCSQQPEQKINLFAAQSKPNVIFILADDLGYGDLGCYGQQKITTPHIDKLAQDGMRFTQHYSGSTVCAPSRSALMTGQHTGHTYIRGNKEVKPEGQHPIADSVLTIAEQFKQSGYVTGAFGKWGLGMADSEGGPQNQGFDEFFGYLCQRYAHRYYPAYLWDNDKKYLLDGNDWKNTTTYAPDAIHDKSLDFIRRNADTAFFMYVPFVIPHAEIIAPDDSLLQKYAGTFEEKPFKGNSYGSENFIKGWYTSQEKPRAVFAAMVSRMDKQVGDIVKLLKELKINENTLVFFTSDNGAHQEGGADPDFFNSCAGLRGYKRDVYEGGIRAPLIAYWPGKIKAGQTSDHISAFWDFMPTFADLTNNKTPQWTDGISLLPTLTGNLNQQKEHEYLYWEFHERGGRQAIRKGKWKAVRMDMAKNPDVVIELYNLEEDRSEQNNIANEHPEIVSEMDSLFQVSHVPSDIFLFDFEK